MTFIRAVALVALVGCGRIGFDPFGGVTINDGDTYARGPRLRVSVRASGTEVRASESCEFFDNGWQPIEDPLWLLVEPVDGTKTACAWSRAGTSVSFLGSDTIEYEAEHVPIVEAFDVLDIGGNRIRATWTVSDHEGLDGVELDYTTEDLIEAAWLPLAGGIAASGARVSGMIELAMPTTSPFVVRIVPRDRAGNRGIAATSNVFNAPGWSVYLGSREHGVGGSALSARLTSNSDNESNQFAIDPISHDVYAVDGDTRVVKLDAATGLVEHFIGFGAPNLPDDGPLPQDARVPAWPAIRFGPDRKLYVSSAVDNANVPAVVYQIDPATRHCRRYLGGGTGNDATATAANVFVWKSVMDFDEEGSLYFLTDCPSGARRILKATQNPDGTAGAISVVAGNCTTGTLPAGGPYPAATSPLPGWYYTDIGTIVAWDRGRVVYYASNPGEVWKVIDGQLWSSNIRTRQGGSLAYERTSGTLFAASTTGVLAYRPNVQGAGGEVEIGNLVDSPGVGECKADGIAAADACVDTEFAMAATPQRLYVIDGPLLNGARTYRVRFVDNSGAIRTYLGSRGLDGDGLHRSVTRGLPAGIAYKSASAPNQAAFPAGLYFVDPHAMLFARVDESSLVQVLWGNETSGPVAYQTGDPIGKDKGVGFGYSAGTMEPLVFDDTGLPWLRYEPQIDKSHLVKLGSNREVVILQDGPGDWENAADGTNPRTLELWPYALWTNLTLKGQAAFVAGGFVMSNPTAQIKILDFAASTTLRIMGTPPNMVTSDRLTPGTVTTASLPSVCIAGNQACYLVYRVDQDRLYFTEDTRLRYITTPSTPATSTLVTLFTQPANMRMYNFTFRPDGSQVYYVTGDGKLRCHDLSSGSPACDDTALGPAVLGRFAHGPNQFAWTDAGTLLISTYNGQVFELQAL